MLSYRPKEQAVSVGLLPMSRMAAPSAGLGLRVETRRVELLLLQCECSVLPLSLRPQGDRWK